MALQDMNLHGPSLVSAVALTCFGAHLKLYFYATGPASRLHDQSKRGEKDLQEEGIKSCTVGVAMTSFKHS